MGELTRVVEIDGRKIENRSGLDVLETLQRYFRGLTEREGTPLDF